METPLKKLRRQRGLTLQHVATAVGIDTGNLSRIERGSQRSPEMAERIVNWFGRDAISELEILYPERYENKEPAGQGAQKDALPQPSG
jgi:transcriptional regulator with XRE-family HTH domain